MFLKNIKPLRYNYQKINSLRDILFHVKMFGDYTVTKYCVKNIIILL